VGVSYERAIAVAEGWPLGRVLVRLLAILMLVVVCV